MRTLIVGVLLLGILSLGLGRGTMAWFTTSVSSTGNVFTAGTLQFNIDDVGAGHLATQTSTISFANMKPGDTVYAPIEIDNVGTLNAVYGIKYATLTTGTQDLADALAITIKGKSAVTTGTKAAPLAIAGGDAALCTSAVTFGNAAWTDAIQLSTAMIKGDGTVAGQILKPVAVGPPPTGLSLLALHKETMCMQIIFTDIGGGAGNNNFNNTTNGATNTTIAFTFDGLAAAAPIAP